MSGSNHYLQSTKTMSNNADGNYLVRVIAGDKVFSGRIIYQR